MAKELPRQNPAGNLAKRLRQHFLAMRYRPGDRIETETELARSFNVSRARIREATTALCQQGLLSRRPRIGTRICQLDTVALGEDLAFRFQMAGLDTADAAEARRVIELAVLPLVVKRVTPSGIAKLQDMLSYMETHLDQPEEADRADRDFHIQLLQACGNQTLQAFAAVIQELFHESVRRQFRTREKFQKALDQHRALLGAIKEEDTEKALAILGEHLKSHGTT